MSHVRKPSISKRRKSVGSYKDALFNPRQADEDESYAQSTAELRAKGITAKRTKKGDEIFQCETCSKWYRHPACLVKHRWQHTDYWQQTASLMLSKHQSVMVLEAAAILTNGTPNGTALPEEKSLWPAAVSPPSSGLFGSEYLNAHTIKAHGLSSPAMQTSISLPVSSLDLLATSIAISKRELSPVADDQSNSDDLMMDLDDDDDDRQPEEGMFAMDEDFEGDKDMPLQVGHRSSSQGSTADSGYASQQPQAASPPVSSGLYNVFLSKRKDTSVFAESGYGLSAPQLGFFEPRVLPSKADPPRTTSMTGPQLITGFQTPQS